jgi:hypothetical protein
MVLKNEKKSINFMNDYKTQNNQKQGPIKYFYFYFKKN